MKIAMFTNTYLPHVGGVARSVHTLETALREAGHEVKVVAPEFEGADSSDEVLRVPAIQNFNGSDFCVRIPFPNLVREFMADFQPDLIHSHHPFLLGDAALREGGKLGVPVVFTHHTLYEQYTHYVPLDSEALKRMAIQLATEYCNLCDAVIAPSRSVADLLEERGVEVPVVAIPTGIDTEFFGSGDGSAFRGKLGIPGGAVVVGHLGRLAGEKNLGFLAEAVEACLREEKEAVFLLVGEGEAKAEIVAGFESAGLGGRVFTPGKLDGPDLAAAYAAMDLFAFASQSETQGMVLAEAMAAGRPVVALDGPGVREVVDAGNGILLSGDASAAEFAEALLGLVRDPVRRDAMSARAQETAREFSTAKCAGAVMELYGGLAPSRRVEAERDTGSWDRLVAGIEVEWDLLAAKFNAVAAGISETHPVEARLD